MKVQKLLTLLLALTLAGFMAGCKEEGEAGDGEEDVQVDDIRVDDVTVEDIQPEEITVDDVPTEDIVVDDVPADEALPDCVSGTLTCTSALTGETTVGATDTLHDYSCATLDETGGDKTYTFTSTEERMVTVEMTTGGEDLDLFVMSGACDPDTCIAYSAAITEESLTFKAEAGVTYYVTVDGYQGATDTYDITVTCALPETCDNGTDDNGNLLIDCTDPECVGTTACTETVCDDTTDNDSDGVADCLDPDCTEAANCYESNCSDTTDNDSDTDIDCVDVDCFGDTACATGTAGIGDPCVSNTDCASGGCWSELLSGWPSGYCLTFGPDDCSTTCPSGSTCVDFSGLGFGPFGCLQDCSSGSCTRAGYRCYTAANVCIPGCTDDAQCTVTGACNEYSTTTGGGNCFPIAEDCVNSTDDDGDNKVDCADYDCMFTSACATVTALAGGDTCAGAVALTMPSGERGQVIVSGTTTGMGDDLTLDCAYGDSNDIVYSFQLTAPAFVMVDVVGGFNPPMSNDTAVSIRTNCTAGPDVVCNDDIETYYHSQVYGSFAAGTYYIVIDGYDDTSPGDFNLSVGFSDLP